MAQDGASVINAKVDIGGNISEELRKIAKELKNTNDAINNFTDNILSKFKNVGTTLEEQIDKPMRRTTKTVQEFKDAVSAPFEIHAFGETFKEIDGVLKSIEPAKLVSIDDIQKAKDAVDKMETSQKEIVRSAEDVENSFKRHKEHISDVHTQTKESYKILGNTAKAEEEISGFVKLTKEQIENKNEAQLISNKVLYSELNTQEKIYQLEQKRKALEIGQSPQAAIDFSKLAQSAGDLVVALKGIDKALQTVPTNTQEAKDLAAAYADVSKRLRELKTDGIETGKSMSQIERGLQNLTQRVLFYGSLNMMKNFMKGIIDTHSEMEKLRVSLNAFFGDVEKGSMVFERIRDMSLVSPHTIQQLGNAVKMLGAYGFELEQAIDLTRRLGDITALTGRNMDRLIPILGYIQDKGFIEKRDLRGLQMAGVNIIPELVKHFSSLKGEVVTTNDVLGMMQDKLVRTSDVIAVINKLTDEGGTYWKGQEKIVSTFSGQISSLKTSISLMMDEFGKQQSGSLNVGIGALKVLVDNYKIVTTAIKGLIVVLGAYKAGQMLARSEIYKTEYALKVKNKEIYFSTAAWGTLRKSIAATTATMRAATTAMLLNPYLWVFAAIVGIAKLGFYLSDVSKKNLELRDSAREAGYAIKKSINDIKDTADKAITVGVTIETITDVEKQIATILGDDRILIQLALEGTKDIEDVNERVKKILENINLIEKALENADLKAIKFKDSFDYTRVESNVKGVVKYVTKIGEAIQGVKSEDAREELNKLYDVLKGAKEGSKEYIDAVNNIKVKLEELSNVKSLERALKGYEVSTKRYNEIAKEIKDTKIEFNYDELFNSINRARGKIFDLSATFKKFDKQLREELPEFDVDFSKADVGIKTLMKNLIDVTVDSFKGLNEKQKEHFKKWGYQKYYIDVEINYTDFHDSHKPLSKFMRDLSAYIAKNAPSVKFRFDTYLDDKSIAEQLGKTAEEKRAEYNRMVASAETLKHYTEEQIALAKQEAEEYEKAAKAAGYKAKERGRGKDLEKQRIDDIVKSLKEAQDAYTKYYNLTSDKSKTQSHIIISLGKEWEALGVSMEKLTEISADKNAGIAFLESLRGSLKSANAKQTLEHAIGVLKVQVELEFEQRAINEIKSELDRIMRGYQVHLEFAKIEDTEVREYMRKLSEDMGITVGVEFDYDEAKERMEELLRNIGVAPTFEEFAAPKLEIGIDIKEIQADWNALVKSWKYGNEDRYKESAEIILKLKELERERLSDFQKIMEQYIAASRSKEDEILELERKNDIARLAIKKATTKEEIDNLNRIIELNELQQSKLREEIYKTSEQYRKLFTKKLTNQKGKDLEALFKWQNKILDSAKEITEGTKQGRYNVQFLFGVDDIEKIDISLETINSLLKETVGTFEELAKKTPFSAIREAMDRLKNTNLSEEMKKFYQDAIKDIKINLAIDISGVLNQFVQSFSFLDDKFKKAANGINDMVNAISTLSSDTSNWGENFNSIISIAIYFVELLVKIINHEKNNAKEWADTLKVQVAIINTEIYKNTKEIENYYRRLSITNKKYNNDLFEREHLSAFMTTIDDLYDNQKRNIESNIVALEMQNKLLSQASTSKNDYSIEIAENQRKIDEYKEKLDYYYADITDKLFGTKLEDAARNFSKIFANSVMEGIDYMDDFRNAFAQMIQNLIVEAFLLPKMVKALDPLFTELDKMIKGKGVGKLTDEDIFKLIGMADETMDAMSAYAEIIRPLLERLKIWSGDTVAGWDTLSKGIQGITEQTAGVLESYLNQMRFSVDLLLENSNYMTIRFDTLIEINSEIFSMMRESVQIQKGIENILLNVSAPAGNDAFKIRMID